jgi:chromosome segregation ATPase
MDRAGIQADIATLKADLKAVQRDEPAIAAELDALEPRIAGIKAARAEADKKQAELIKHEDEDQRRTIELYEAIGAKRKVVERAAAEAEAARDVVLFELGERLYVDRPAELSAQMSPIDRIDLELGETDRRIMELREILSNIDRSKVLRGAAVILAAALVVAAFVAWLLYKLL